MDRIVDLHGGEILTEMSDLTGLPSLYGRNKEKFAAHLVNNDIIINS